MNTLSFPNKFWRSPNLAIIVLDSFVVSVGPIYIDRACHKRLHHCHLHRSLQTRLLQLSVSDNPPQQIQNSLALAVAKAPKSCHITHILGSLHWLRITERVECKLFSLTKVFATRQPPCLYNLISVHLSTIMIHNSLSLSLPAQNLPLSQTSPLFQPQD